MFQKLQDRNNYLNRPHKRGKKKTDTEENPVKNKKSFVSARAGCSKWSSSLPAIEHNEVIDPQVEYAEQRDFINNNPTLVTERSSQIPQLIHIAKFKISF